MDYHYRIQLSWIQSEGKGDKNCLRFVRNLLNEMSVIVGQVHYIP